MIIRKEKIGNYSKVDNALWTDKRLTVTARFILGFMLSLPDDWRFNLSWIAKQIGMNRDTVGKYVQELIDNGFIIRERVRHDDGTFGDYEYTVYEDADRQKSDTPENAHRKDKMSLQSPAPTYADDTCAEDFRTTKTDKPLTKTNKKSVVVATSAKILANVIDYPSSIIETLSRHNLTANAATLRRWLSLASEETIVQVIEYAAGRNVRSIIGYITAVLQQGWTVPTSAPNGLDVVKRPKHRNGYSVKRDILPDWVVRQQSGKTNSSSDLTEEQRQEAARLLAALGE